jgi:lactoylglutathione lyase
VIKWLMVDFLKSLVTIYSSDIARAVEFYGKILGLEETYRFPYSGEPEHVEFRVGNTTIAVGSPAGLQRHGMPPASPGHPFEIGIKTDDVDAAVRMLRAAGVPVLREPGLSAAGNRYAYVADPDGNWISLYQTMA